MNLAATQRRFLTRIVGEDDACALEPDQRNATGLAIYRNAYRARLVDALGETFPVTQRWVGDEAFARAAAHHCIANPPSSWSLDHLGEGFAQSLAGLFGSDPEVAELATLEWDMHCLFVAADAQPLDHASFSAAVAGFADEDWAGIRFSLNPGLAIRTVRTCCGAIWRALSDNSQPPTEILLPEPGAVIVWREGLRPVFRTADVPEAQALELAREGASFGEICETMAGTLGEDMAASEAGTMLGRWIGDGLIAGLA